MNVRLWCEVKGRIFNLLVTASSLWSLSIHLRHEWSRWPLGTKMADLNVEVTKAQMQSCEWMITLATYDWMLISKPYTIILSTFVNGYLTLLKQVGHIHRIDLRGGWTKQLFSSSMRSSSVVSVHWKLHIHSEIWLSSELADYCSWQCNFIVFTALSSFSRGMQSV